MLCCTLSLYCKPSSSFTQATNPVKLHHNFSTITDASVFSYVGHCFSIPYQGFGLAFSKDSLISLGYLQIPWSCLFCSAVNLISNYLDCLLFNVINDLNNITDLLVDLEVEMRFGGDEIGGDSRFFDFLGSKSKFLLA